MTGIRVLRVYHSAVVAEYRHRERWLREKHGYDVHVVSPPAWPEGGSDVIAVADADVPLHVVPVSGRVHPILFWYRSRAFRRVLRDVRPHVLDLHEEPYSLATFGALRDADRVLGRIPVCVYTAQNIFKRYPMPFRAMEARALRRAAAAYPCSTEAGEVLRRKGYGGALHVLPLGVTPADAVRQAPNGHRRVGFVGRLVPQKGARVALEAFAKAGDDGATLEFVGSGPDEPVLRELSDRLGVGSRVIFSGAVSQDDALHRIGRFDVLVVPSLSTRSWKEQFGRVAAQALAAGTPVLASDSGSLPELLDGSGELAREGDARDFAAKLSSLLANPVRRAELAERGRTRAAAFTWERVADGFDQMYREVLGRD